MNRSDNSGIIRIFFEVEFALQIRRAPFLLSHFFFSLEDPLWHPCGVR